MWFLYSIIGLTLLGLGDFIKKLMLKNGGDKEVFLFMCFLFYTIAFFINYILFADKIVTYDLVKNSVIMGFFDFLAPFGMLTALKYLDSSFSFISIRLTSSFLILYIGITVLGDKLTNYNILGFLLGVIALYILSGFNIKQNHKIHKKGIIGVIMAIVGIVLGHSYFKYIVDGLDIPSYTFFKFIVTFSLLVIYMTIRKKFTNFNEVEVKKIINYALLSCVIFVIYFLYITPNIYKLGTLSLSYKMLSYSLIIPIILSIIFFNEKITKGKIIGFVLTIVSLGLFLF
ncbi:MAG: hypothetical protein PHE25_05170 [Candidatus Gracilibacteria bacterium]|nr:hypothetical protein [Candidatus Gracilibacteria bacterium]